MCLTNHSLAKMIKIENPTFIKEKYETLVISKLQSVVLYFLVQG